MYRLWVVGLLLAACLSAQTNPSPEELLRHAIELQQAGDMEGAVQGYRQFLAVRFFTNCSRTRWSACRSCCSSFLIGTKRIDGLLTASQIASASLGSFLLPLR